MAKISDFAPGADFPYSVRSAFTGSNRAAT